MRSVSSYEHARCDDIGLTKSEFIMILRTGYSKRLVVFLFIGMYMMCMAQTKSGNNSETTGNYSASRLAYYRWRQWLMSQPAILQKVPPIPKTGNAKDKLNITLKLTPITIFQIDAGQQTVQMSARVEVWWQDQALAVDHELVEEFTDGQDTVMPSSLSLPSKALWLPPALFVEGVSPLSIWQEADEASVNQDGLINMEIPLFLTFGCQLHMDAFPFDEHFCPISVFANSFSANIYPSGLAWASDVSGYFGVSGEWDLVNVTEETLSNPSQGGLAYPQFVVHIRRKTTFYSVVILFPMVLTSYLNTLVFLLPPDLGDKASYLVTLTVSMSVYSAFFISDMPRGLDSMPDIFVLLIFVYVESFCTMLLCLVVLRKYASEQRQQATEVGITSRAPSMCKGEVASELCDNNNGKKHSRVSAKQVDSIFFVTGFVLHTAGLAYILTSLQH